MRSVKKIVYVLAAAAAAAIAVLIIRFAQSGSVDTPQVILPTQAAVTEAPPEETAESGDALEITPDTVQTAVGLLSRAESYSRTLTVERLWDGGSQTREISVWVRGGSVRISEDAEQGGRNVLIAGGEMWIWYAGEDGVFHAAADENAADEYQELDSYETLLGLDRSQILDAGYDEYAGEYCIFAEYVSGSFGYTTRVWISVATGLLMRGETWDGDTMIHGVSSSQPDISTPVESVFKLPES